MILPPKKTSKVRENNLQNRRRPSYARGLLLAGLLGALFILFDWFAQKALSIEFPSPSQKTLIYSNQTGDDLHLLFCEALASAKKSIFLEMYAITDSSILALLKNQSASGKEISIHADKKASPSLKKKLGTKESRTQITLHTGQGLMHRKILTLDEDLVFLGSTNFTTASLKMHDNLVFASQNPELAKFLIKTTPPWIYTDPDLKVWKLPESGKEALAATEELLMSAKKTICVAMFTFTHMSLAHKLVCAKERGVDVQVALDHYTRQGSSKKVADFLEENHIPVYVSQGIQLLHHKWALIDGNTLLAGSANWTQRAFKKNKDLLFVLSPLNEEVKTKIHALWNAVLSNALSQSS